MTTARTLRTILTSALVGTCLLLASRPVGAQDPVTTAGIPPAAKPTTTNLDEWLAFVEGDFITRRMIQREIGERAEDQSESDYERQVHTRLLMRALNDVMVRQAKLMTLEVRPDQVDKYAEEAAKAEVEQAREREEKRKPGAGRTLTFEKLLAERGQTMDEFKELITREVLVRNYWRILFFGVPGKRAVLNSEPAPGEVLRLYQKHADKFDRKQGVRLVVYFASPESFLEDGRRTYDEAVAAAKARLEGLLAEVRSGRPLEEVAKAHQLTKADWNAVPPGKFVEAGARSSSKAADEWAFDPARKPGDGAVFDGMRGMLVGYGVLEVRPARKMTYDDVRDDLSELIRNTRLERFRIHHILECLSTATIQPPSIAEELEGQFRDALKAMDEDPVRKDIRLP